MPTSGPRAQPPPHSGCRQLHACMSALHHRRRPGDLLALRLSVHRLPHRLRRHRLAVRRSLLVGVVSSLLGVFRLDDDGDGVVHVFLHACGTCVNHNTLQHMPWRTTPWPDTAGRGFALGGCLLTEVPAGGTLTPLLHGWHSCTCGLKEPPEPLMRASSGHCGVAACACSRPCWTARHNVQRQCKLQNRRGAQAQPRRCQHVPLTRHTVAQATAAVRMHERPIATAAGGWETFTRRGAQLINAWPERPPNRRSVSTAARGC